MNDTQSKNVSVETNRRVVAVCEWATYDVWGNARDGYEVNDVFRQGEIRIPARMVIHNLPTLPEDGSASIKPGEHAFAAFCLAKKDIRAALGITGRFDIDGNTSDDMIYNLTAGRREEPLAEIHILRFEELSAEA